MKDNPTVLNFFELYLTDHVIDLMVTKTNNFVDDYLLENPDRS